MIDCRNRENQQNQHISIWEAKNRLTYNEPLQPGDPLFVETSSARGDFSLKRLYGTGSVQLQCRRKSEAYVLKTEQNLQLSHWPANGCFMAFFR
ncbi:MAG: hypothetical protein D3921_13860 [Candidatus Electrothrix sp. AW1]|nr:hypothetical protein [Candidatus Electrothrix sp. AX1]MCI5183579.1 hypothetical protein [Candidatus Electrothrix gigas]